MSKRAFFVALGIPRGAPPEAIQVAYRRVVTRYRRELEEEEEPTPPPGHFAVMRTYSERRHSALFDEPEPEPLIPQRSRASEVDRFYDGFVPEAVAPARARRDGKDLFVELRLATEEAERGGLFPVHIPVVRRCTVCEDWTVDHRLRCPHCHGAGQVLEDRMVEVAAPPGVQHGQTARLAMEDVGLEDTDMVVWVLVGLLR